MKQLDWLTVTELKTLLKGMKSYVDMSKKLGARWKALFERQITGENSYRVEYGASLDENAAWEKASSAFQKWFWETLSKDQVVFVESRDISGWIKVFQNDDMLDMTLDMACNKIL